MAGFCGCPREGRSSTIVQATMITTGVSIFAAFFLPFIGIKLYLHDNWRTVPMRLVPPRSVWIDLLLVMVMGLLWWMRRTFTRDSAGQRYNSPATTVRTSINHPVNPLIALWQDGKDRLLGLRDRSYSLTAGRFPTRHRMEE